MIAHAPEPSLLKELNSSGFNLIGYASSPTGLGEDLRTFAILLDFLEIPFSITDIPTDSSGKLSYKFKNLSNDLFATSIFFMSPMECENNFRRYPQLFKQAKTKIGYFLWELPDFPEKFLPALKLVDQIWCPTKFVQSAFMAKSKQLTLAIPLPVIQAKPPGRNFREELGIPKAAFVSLFMFDLHSTLNRKNPQGVVQAFEEFAKDKDDVYLILKINRWEGMDRRLLEWLPQTPKIKLVTETLDMGGLADLYQSSNCYLSLHRSEGFGRTLVEALQHGLWIVASNYSGPADFLNEENCKIVNWLPQTVFKGDYPHNSFSMWADPVVSEAVTALNSLYREKRGKRCIKAIESGAAFSVSTLAKKYSSVIRSYLK